MRNINVFKRHLREKRAIKIITGVNNFDLEQIKKIAAATQAGLASALNITCDKAVYDTAKANTKLPIFVSSIHPFKLAQAVKWGADAIEIGSYGQEEIYSADELYEITLETMSLVEDSDVFVCVSIPAYISMEEQIELAKKLELLGVDLIQAEGTKNITTATGMKALIENCQTAITNANELSSYVSIPIMATSGITSQTTPLAIEAGASGVGVGSAISKLDTQVEMTAAIRNIVASIAYRNSLNAEIATTKRELEMFKEIYK